MITIAVTAEGPDEPRVAISPETVKKLKGMGCTVKVQAERADTEPKVFTKIHMHFTVSGRGLPAAAVARAIQLSHERYCSASIMLGKTAEITTSHEVVEA